MMNRNIGKAHPRSITVGLDILNKNQRGTRKSSGDGNTLKPIAREVEKTTSLTTPSHVLFGLIYERI